MPRLARYYKKKRPRKRLVKKNWQITAPEVRLINSQGKQEGVVSIETARQRAKDRGLDLVEIAPQAKPPVVKIIEYSKYKYQQEKKSREERKKNKKGDKIKEIRLTPFIGEADLKTRVNRAKKFAKEQDRLRIVVKFLGRQITQKKYGLELLNKVKQELEGLYQEESKPKFVGKRLILLMKPIKTNGKKEKKEN